MDKRFYIYIILSLVGLNIFVSAFFLFFHPSQQDQPPRKNIRSEIIESFHFNKEQETAFTKLADDHKHKMEEISKHQKELLHPYFEGLANPAISVNKDSILYQIQQLEKEKIEVTHQHFEDIKALLNDDQMPYYKDFIKKITTKLLSKKKKSLPRPEGI